MDQHQMWRATTPSDARLAANDQPPGGIFDPARDEFVLALPPRGNWDLAMFTAGAGATPAANDFR